MKDIPVRGMKNNGKKEGIPSHEVKREMMNYEMRGCCIIGTLRAKVLL